MTTEETKKQMAKLEWWGLVIMALGLLAVLLCAGCSWFGANPKGPSKVERAVFDTVTNYVTQVVPVTNVVTKTVEIPVSVTNVTGVTVFTTNTVTERFTNVSSMVVTQEAYTLTPKAAAETGANVAGGLANLALPGAGGMVTTGLLALLAAWGHLRSSKLVDTSAALAQEVEAVREFIKTLPKGTQMDQAITGFLQNHQVEAGVAQQVVKLLGQQVNNADAKAAASEIANTIKVASGTS